MKYLAAIAKGTKGKQKEKETSKGASAAEDFRGEGKERRQNDTPPVFFVDQHEVQVVFHAVPSGGDRTKKGGGAK